MPLLYPTMSDAPPWYTNTFLYVASKGAKFEEEKAASDAMKAREDAEMAKLKKRSGM